VPEYIPERTSKQISIILRSTSSLTTRASLPIVTNQAIRSENCGGELSAVPMWSWSGEDLDRHAGVWPVRGIASLAKPPGVRLQDSVPGT
jgi:hypothetical protein